MKKILLFFVVILSATIEAQTYKPHSVNNAINNPKSVLLINRYTIGFRNYYSRHRGYFDLYILPPFSPEGINEITIQLFKSEEYFGEKVREKEPYEEYIVTYENSILKSYKRKNGKEVYVIDNIFESGSFYILSESKYDLNTGKRCGTYREYIYNFYGGRYVKEDYYLYYRGWDDYFDYWALRYITRLGSSLFISGYDLRIKTSFDETRKYKKSLYYNRNLDYQEDIINYIEYLVNEDYERYKEVKEGKIAVIPINAYGVHRNLDFNNYNYVENLNAFVKYILK